MVVLSDRDIKKRIQELIKSDLENLEKVEIHG